MIIDESKLPKQLYISGGWKRPRKGSNVQGPIEEFSPSQIEKFDGADRGCQFAWGFRYILGVTEQFQNEAAKNGELLHGQIHSVYDGKPLPLGDPKQPPKSHEEWIARRALPGLIHLPRFDQCVEIHRETQEWIDTSQVAPHIEPLRIQVKKDLEIATREGWLIYDHKSVKKWEYQKDSDDLQGDPQALLYAIDTMQRRGTSIVPGRWVYYMMDPEKEPESRVTDTVFQWTSIAPRVRAIVETADRMRSVMRNAKSGLPVFQNELQPNTYSCFKFYSPTKGTGACAYSKFAGGPCPHGATPPDRKKGKQMTAQPAPQPFPFALPSNAAPAAVAPPPATTGVSVPTHYASAGGTLPLNLPPLPFAPPEAYAPPPVAAPAPPPPAALPPLPPGWVYVDGRPVPAAPAAAAELPPLQPGYVRGANGEAIFVGQNAAAQPSATTEVIQTTIAPHTGPGSGEKQKRKRRTKAEMEAARAAEKTGAGHAENQFEEPARTAPGAAKLEDQVVEGPPVFGKAPPGFSWADPIVTVTVLENGTVRAKLVDDAAAARQLRDYVGI